jgi:hypothetical protein
MKVTGSALVVITSILVFQSCIFDADPESSNSPPYIKESFPEELFLRIVPPVDSIMFSFSAADPDGDALVYSYVLVDDDCMIIKELSHGPEYVFKPEESGLYHLQGRARDHSDFAARDWHVSAGALNNGPPLIVRCIPDQDSISTLAGSSHEFMLEVEDDHPEYLRYSYYIGSEPIKVMDDTSSAKCRFLETGFFDITGSVWDGEYGDTMSWVVRVVEEPDAIAPARIVDLVGWAGIDTGSIRLEWTATGDDGMDGRAYCYMIRTSASYIIDEYAWDEASRVEGAPVPGMPGTTERMTAGGLDPGAWLYVTVRVVDDFGNMSGLGDCIRLAVRGNGTVDGVITDAATGAPLEGIAVSAEDNTCISYADGYYMLTETCISGDLVMFSDEEVSSDQGDYFDMAIPDSCIDWHISTDFTMMPCFELVSVLAGSYDENFYTFFRYMTNTRGLLGRPTIFRNWNHFPVTIYNPPFSWEGVDIQDLARVAMFAWNDLTGCELFVELTEPGAADVEIIYDITVSNTKHHVETVSLNEDGTPAKKLICIYPAHQIAPVQIRGRRIFAHEMGHVLQLGHSFDLGHLMVGGTMPITDDPSEDEINLIRTLYGMPTVFDATWYLGD